MPKRRVGLVTAWGECGMGYLARNWIYTFEKYPDLIEYQIFSRALPWLTPFRWHGPNVVEGPESMDIDHPLFWQWVERFKPEVIFFQDQNLYGRSAMREESARLHRLGIKLINYPDWVRWGDVERYRGLYDVNLAHVERNYRWLVTAGVENPTLIRWGVILKHFPYIQRQADKLVRFYLNAGTGTPRKGYEVLPKTLRALDRLVQRAEPAADYQFLLSAIEGSRGKFKSSFLRRYLRLPRARFIIRTADNLQGGLFSLGDVYVYPTRREGVGLTITEAMATGMPVVVPDYPTMNEWLTDRVEGRLIKVRKVRKSSLMTGKVFVDEHHLAEILLDYLEHPERVAEQSLAARKKVETEYNWDDRDGEILRLLDVQV